MTARLPSVLLALAVLASSARAQTAPLKPVAEYLPAMDSGSADAKRHVGSRCAALYMVVAEQMNVDSAALEGLKVPGTFFLLLAVQAEVQLGSSEDDALLATEGRLKDAAELLRQRMRANLAAKGDYNADDPLLRSDVETCAALLKRDWSS